MRQQLISIKTLWLARRGEPARRGGFTRRLLEGLPARTPLGGPPESTVSRAWGRGHEVAGIIRKSLQMHARFSPFLTGSDSQTEFDVTLSKQTTENFLTGARMHISVSRKQRANERACPPRRAHKVEVRRFQSEMPIELLAEATSLRLSGLRITIPASSTGPQ
jgi:hypothetical protein